MKRRLFRESKGLLFERDHEPLWSGSFVLILIVAFFGFVVVQGSNTGTSAYLALKGASATYIGIVAMVFTMAAAVTRVISGGVVDVCGRYRVLMVGASVMLLGVLGALTTPCIELMWLCRMLQGIGFASVTTAAATMAADVVPANRLGEGVSYYGLAQAVSMTIGPGLALFLVSLDPPETMYFVLLVCSVALLFCSSFCVYEKHPRRLPTTASYRERCGNEKGGSSLEVRRAEDGSRSGFWRSLFSSMFEPGCLKGAIPAFFLAPVFAFGIFYLSAYAESMQIGYGGAFYAVASIVMIVVRLMLGSWIDSCAPIKAYRVPIAGGVLAFLLLLFSGGCHELFLFAGLLYGVCMGVANPLNQTVCIKCAPEEKHGIANGMYLLGVDLGVGMGSAAWGVCVDVWGFHAAIVCSIAMAILSYAIALWAYPKSASE